MAIIHRRRGISAAVAILAGLQAVNASAQEANPRLALEEVIVTATKQEESLSDVAVSVVALGNERIDALGFRGLDGLLNTVPNVKIATTPTGAQLTVRGIGSPGTAGVSASVATIIDGVYLGNSRSNDSLLFDMQRVEVLRGPQGTLFGKNAIAGVFSLSTARPTEQFEGLIDVRAGNYNSHEGTLVLSGGLTDSLSARFAAFNRRTGDYLNNTISGADAGGTDSEAYRLSVNWRATDNTNVWFKYEHNHSVFNAGVNQLIALDPLDREALERVAPDWVDRVDTRLDRNIAMSNAFTSYGMATGLGDERYNRLSRDIFALALEHSFDNGYDFTAIAGYDSSESWAKGSLSAAHPLMTIYGDSPYEFETSNLELRLTSPRDEKLRFTVGAYAEQSKDIFARGNFTLLNFDALAAPIGGLLGLPEAVHGDLTPALMVKQRTDLVSESSRSEVTSWAAFAEVTYEFNEQWLVTAGLRYSKDRIESRARYDNRYDFNNHLLGSLESAEAIVGPGPLAQALSATISGFMQSVIGANLPNTPAFKETHRDQALSPALRVEYRPDPDSLLYFTAQTGYKNGGFSSASLGDPTGFDKEKSTAFELGGKFTIADGRGQLNAALFRTKFKDLQVAISDPVTGTVGFDNAAEAVSQGAELGLQWRLTQALTAGLSYGYLDASYTSFPNAPCNVSAQIETQAMGPGAVCDMQNLRGKPLNNAPRNTASASLDYHQPLWGALELGINLTVSYADSFYTEIPNSKQLKGDAATLVDARVALTDTARQWTVALIGQNLTDDDGLVVGSPSSLGTHKGTYRGQMRPPATYWLQLEKRF